MLLYELLTGFRPYVLTRKESAAMARAIFEQQSARPSHGSPDLPPPEGLAARQQ